MKFKVGDKVKVVSYSFENSLLEIGEIGLVTKIREGAMFPVIVVNKDGVEESFKESELSLVKENKRKKTFREVIADIKEGECWVNDYFKIYINYDGDIRISKLNDEEFNHSIALIFSEKDKFKLQRKTYSFNEAFRYYEEGKVIESNYGYKYKKIGNEDYVFEDEEEGWIVNEESFAIDEIREKWFIEE